MDPQFFEVDLAGVVQTDHVDHDQNAGDPVRCGGGDSHAQGTHAESQDHDQVQNDVGSSRDGQKHERTGGVSLGSQDRCAIVIEHVGRRTCKVGNDVCDCLRQDGLVCAHGSQKGT